MMMKVGAHGLQGFAGAFLVKADALLGIADAPALGTLVLVALRATERTGFEEWLLRQASSRRLPKEMRVCR
jgi:hypothetical protein